jgi:putative SOS response-associated peptidase YedK
MCGRYTLTSPAEAERALGELLSGTSVLADLPPRFNIAPTQAAPVIANRLERSVELFRWGLVPHWADGLAIGAKLINARAESLADKPAFREAIAKRRCLVPADGFYEWRTAGKKKEPLWVRTEPRRVLMFAGLWATWRPKDGGDAVESFTIVTTEPNASVAPYHDRMPVIVEREDWSRWLQPGPLSLDAFADILAPSRSALVVVPVSTAVNSVANDGPECVEPSRQGSLF